MSQNLQGRFSYAPSSKMVGSFKNLRYMPAQKPGASDDRPFIFDEHFGPPLQARNPM